MADKAIFEIVVTNKGLKITQKGVDDLGASVERTKKRTQEANKVSGDYYNTQAKGVIGTANSTKSFSKLAETIGSGGGGLVGAYATLAANAFAVSAAFNALRSATQAEMVLRGLEEQGGRTGRTLTLAAQNLREVVGFSISSSEAMQATALFTATGFSSEELEKLGTVAFETSLALGRNLPDSIDRLIKGTTKLEPELLDELGIMTKLGDATAAYALEIQKPVASLTQFERRQAFLNAVLAEGQLKFGGLAEEIDPNPYDKLAASFSNLVKETTSFINTGLGVANVVSFLSDNSNALAGVLILFGATIKNQLLGSLSDLSERSAKSAAITREYAKEIKNLVAVETQRALAEGKSRISQAANIQIAEKSAAAIKKQSEAIKSGSLSVEELDKVLNTNNRSLRSHTALLAKDSAAGKDTTAREATIKALQEQQSKLEILKKVTQEFNAESVKSAQVQIAAKQASAANAKARSQEAMATAIESINQNKLRLSYNALILSSKEYALALALETRAKKLSAAQGGALAASNYVLARSTLAVRVAFQFAAGAAKILGAALLNMLPILGMVMVAWDLLKSGFEAAYKFFYPKTAEAQELVSEKTEAFDEVLKTATKSQEYYNKIMSSSTALGIKASLAAESQANSVAEQTKALRDLIAAKEEEKRLREEESTGVRGTFLGGFFTGALDPKVENKTEQLSKRIGTLLASGIGDKEIAENIRSGFNSIEKSLGTERLTKELKELGLVIRPLADSDIPEAAKALESLDQRNSAISQSTKDMREAFQTAESSITKLVSSIVPSTGFDDTISAFDTIVTSIGQMEAAGQSASSIVEQITAAGRDLELFLDRNTVELLDSFREADRIAQTLGSRIESLNSIDKERLSSAQKLLSNIGNYKDQIKEGLAAAREDLEAKREAVALSQVQASIEQNRFSKFQAYLNVGAAGYRAQIQSEEKIRALNIAGISANKAILDSKIAQEEVAISKLKTELESLKAEETSVSNIEEFNKKLIDQLFMLEARKELIGGTTFSSGLEGLRQSGVIARNPLEQALRNATGPVEDTDTEGRAADLANQLEAAERALSRLRLASKLLGLQITSEVIKGLTNTQIQAKEALKRVEEEYQRYQRKEATLEAQHSERLSAIRGNAVRKGSEDTLGVRLREIQEEFDFRYKALQRNLIEEEKVITRRIADAAAMRATANQAEREGLDEYIAQQNDILSNLTQQNATKISQLRLDNEANILSEIGLSNEVKRSDAILQSTEYLAQQLDTARSLSEAMQDLYASERELEEARGGFRRSESRILERSDRIEAAEEAVRIASLEFKQRKSILELEYALLDAKRRESLDRANESRIELSRRIALEKGKGPSADLRFIEELESRAKATESIITNLGGTLVQEGANVILDYGKGFSSILEDGVAILDAGLSASINRAKAAREVGPRVQGGLLAQFNQARAGEESIESGKIATLDSALIQLEDSINRIRPQLEALGPEGSVVLAIMDGTTLMAQSFVDLSEAIKSGDFGSIAVAGLQAMSSAIQTVSSILRASSDAKIASIDREIAAEQKRDGKSAQSLAAIEAMEKKKDSIARKQFNTNKKLMMANAVVSTAAGIANALGSGLPPPANIILAGLIGAMGAAQLAIISGTQYESASASRASTPPSTLTIGRRGDSVDLARGPSANAGGEVGFIRGSQGTGSNASNFRTIGSAYGGELMRGYGNRGFVVGEKGPEVITPETPINVTPANDVMPSQPVNATFNIQALDASGVEELLLGQKGNIISMLRSAANASGEGFMESVNTNIYTRPSVNKL